MDSSNVSFLRKGAALGLILALVFLYNLARSSRHRKYREAPQPPGAWPIIGHLPLLGGQPNMGRVLTAIGEKQGPIFTLRLGMRRMVVVSSSELAKECLATNDRVLANLPRFAAGELMGYNYAMLPLSPYGNYWREIRKICTLELLSNARLEQLKHVRVEEIGIFTKEIYDLCTRNDGRRAEVEMGEWFKKLTFNVVARMVAGKRFSGGGQDSHDARRFIKTFTDFMVLVDSFVPSDLFPFLGWLDLGGHIRAMKSTAREMDTVLESWLAEHREKRSKIQGNHEESDFMDVLLKTVEKGNLSHYSSNTIIKANSLALLIAGTDSTSNTLTWALSLLVNHSCCLKKAQQELDTHVGPDRQVQESDVKNLVYLQAIIKETFRMYPATPALVPHMPSEDCSIGGYDVRAGTRLVVNLWAIQRNPKIWSDPSSFNPERFLTGHVGVDVRGQHFELLPFGSGRRSCPAITLAQQVMHLTLARLIHGFDMTTTGGPVDMNEGLGLTMPRSTPLRVMFIPRLPAELYG